MAKEREPIITSDDPADPHQECWWATIVLHSDIRSAIQDSTSWGFLTDQRIRSDAQEAFHQAAKVLKRRHNQGKRERKVIITDVDGVLNCSHPPLAEGLKPCKGNPRLKLHPLLVGRLRALMDATGADLVISSTWRQEHMEPLVDFFEDHGIPERRVVGKTPWLADIRRKEIQTWLKHHNEISAYVILDDAIVWDPTDPHFLHINYRTGLTSPDVVKAVEVLGPAGGTVKGV